MIKRLFRLLTIERLAFVVIFLKLFYFQPLVDTDYYWHLAAGRLIVEGGALPAGDPFSHTLAGAPWVLHEWLFQVVLYLAHSAFGETGVRLLVSVTVVAALVLVYRFATHYIARPLPRIALLLLLLLLWHPYLTPRPHLFSLFAFAFALYAVMRWKYEGVEWLLWLLPPLMVVWVNAHGGYLVGIVLLAAVAVLEWWRHLWAGEGDGGARRRLGRFTLAASVTAAASLLNPGMGRHLLYPLEVMGLEAVGWIAEWQPPSMRTFNGALWFGAVALLFLQLIYRRIRPDFTEAVLASLFVGASLSAMRHIPLASMVLAAVAVRGAAGGFTVVPPRWAWLERLRGWSRASPAFQRELGEREVAFNWVVLVLVGVAMLVYHPTHRQAVAEYRAGVIPERAVDFIEEHGLHGRMFNTYRYGGYLIWRLYPDQRVFIDGRADLYGNRLFNDYLTIYRGGTGWQTLFERYGIDYVVCERGAPLRQLLLERGDFVLVYDEGNTSVLVNDIPRYAELIERYRTAEGAGS